jgi:four helix bundle protein
MTSQSPDSNDQPFDLEERTAVYAEAVIDLVKPIAITSKTARLIDQVVGASSSVAANYCEANESESKRAFRNHINRCRKEAKEACLFLRLIARAVPDHADNARRLWKEGRERVLIFAKIERSTRGD